MNRSAPSFDVAIVGAGFCGTMLAVHLADEPRIRSVLFERDTFARGLAYSTQSPRHLLNLPAGKMSAFPDKPRHFVDWLGSGDADAFVERRHYARYLRAVFDAATAGREQLVLRAASIQSIERQAGGYRLLDDASESTRARNVVLANGLFAPSGDMFDEAVQASPRYIGDPWSLGADKLFGDVFIVGTGLTAIDVLVELHHRRFAGTVIAVSRHGLLPQTHLSYGEPISSAPDRRDALATLRSVRKTIAECRRSGVDWRAVVDGIRPLSRAIWQSWPLSEKQRFLRHVKPFWETSRRRVPPEPRRVISEMEANGTLRRQAGHIRSARFSEGGRFRIAVERAGDVRYVEADWIVNCSGPCNDVTKIDDPLVTSLLRHGLIVPHPTSLGIQATPQAQVIGRNGIPKRDLFATGLQMRGVLYESVSVAELSGQMKALADHLTTIVTSGTSPAR
ncbi:MAG: FAD/NAD(P)-binding protein [Candidatus Eremiobacteraeota bacterium]|nr:FAD/NAD(P)-binding protein [Candidatus Eremiobacteraeota bacterium]